MAFFLKPRFAPVAQHCGPSFCAPSRPVYRQPVPALAAVPSFVPFLNQVEELLSEIDRETHQVADAQRQHRKRIFRARFDVRENGQGYEVEGELPGFEQENISIEVTDEHTLKVGGRRTQTQNKAQAETLAVESKTTEALTEKLEGATLAEDNHSDNSSQKSFQPTVEDDYEDLGAETSSTVSAAPSEPKGKEKAVDAPAQQQVQLQQQRQQQQSEELLTERVHGSFERNFRFPDRIDAAGVRASLRNGVLSITVPKAPVPAIRNIAIR